MPLGGHAWAELQYLLGLRSLGCEVYYLEDIGPESWVYRWEDGTVHEEVDAPARFIEKTLAPWGLEQHWHFRSGNRCRGMTTEAISEVCNRADLLIVRGAPLAVWREQYRRVRRKIFLDVDPGFTQFQAASGASALCQTLQECDRLFTIAQRMGRSDCAIPDLGRDWLRTRPPVCLDLWPSTAGGTHFTSVLQWRSYAEVQYQGQRYGNKNREFGKFVDLPKQSTEDFELALTGSAEEDLQQRGWRIVPGWRATATAENYQQYIQGSAAEFSVAKHGYVATRGGWFSDRSVCYLASGKPILIQDTGLDWLSVGEGVVTFNNLRQARQGAQEIMRRYDEQAAAARQIAHEHFDSQVVLRRLLADAI